MTYKAHLQSAIPPVVRALQRAKAFAARWRTPLLAAGIVAVIVGCALSIDALGLRWGDLRLLPMLAVVALVVPLSIVYSALNVMLMARAAKVPMDFRDGVKVSVFAQVAELLPLPGGALVRGAALVRAGSSARRSAELVVAFSLLWIAIGAVGAGVALAPLGWPALALAVAGGALALAIIAWLAIGYGMGLAAAAATLRVLGVGLVAIRLVLVFAVIGVALPGTAALSFAFAAIAGSAASLVPAGLGVSEGLSALIAHPVGVAPPAAFLAAALSRLIGMAINIALALAFMSGGARPSFETTHA